MSVSLIICGDFRAANPAIVKMSDEVKDLFNHSDLQVCNFEAPVHTPGAKPIKKSGPALEQSADSPALLMNLGFNVILLANNHIMDYGREGCEATIRAFSQVATVGAGSADDAFAVRYFEINGITVGLLSLVQKEFGTIDGKDSEDYGAAWICSPDVPDIIKEAKSHCGFLLVLPHAGAEYASAPLPGWRSLYKRFIDYGADAVIASHPHCPQGWETYKGKPIYYSLGNFYFDELTFNDLWYKGLVLELTIGDGLDVKEHFVCFDDKTGMIAFDRSDRIRKHIERANRLISDTAEYERYIDRICSARWPGYKYGLLRGLCGVSLRMKFKDIIRLSGGVVLGKKDEMYLLNVLQCESHRWMVERYLRNKNIV